MRLVDSSYIEYIKVKDRFLLFSMQIICFVLYVSYHMFKLLH